MNTQLSVTNKIGLGLAAVLGLGDVASLGTIGQDMSPGEQGPPAGVTIFSAVLGVITLVGIVIAWRSGSRPALRAVAGSRILSMILGLPAFFADGVPAGWVVVSAVAVVLTLLALALMFRKSSAATAGSAGGSGEASRAGAAR
jgi:hypothetical protein